ncbi:MAG TPA: PfkB family carbohydrate kinase [Gaiellaceae bacterium]|nr:PfkB family carbohydrate kinase [Gaiellaceae bacterium]
MTDGQETDEPRSGRGSSAPALCVGESLVDLICERPVASFAEADAFVPHPGGAPTNVAVTAARAGGAVALAGGAGDDAWGRWLEARLTEEGVDLRFWRLLPGEETAVAFAVLDRDAVPEFLIYGDGIRAAMAALEPVLDEAVAASSAVVLGSNTMVGETERRVTLRARELAIARGAQVLFDWNLRLHRWRDRDEAVVVARTVCDGALLVKLNADEALLLTGESDPARAAEAVTRLGSRLALVTLGPDGALLRGEAATDAAGVPAAVVDTTGAGDALMGVVLAALVSSGYDPAAAAGALPRAVECAARTAEHFGALG